jgi:FtsP/CotA-like multicopper oxidase with cupredoxin domain
VTEASSAPPTGGTIMHAWMDGYRGMREVDDSRRRFLKTAGLAAGTAFMPIAGMAGQEIMPGSESHNGAQETGPADYTVRIQTVPVELASNRIISATTYNGQFPGPLLRFREGQQVTVDIFNDTDVAEQLHWHGQMVPTDVDGASEEGTPYIPARGRRRIAFMPPGGTALLSHPPPRGRKPVRRAIQRTSWPGVHRTTARAGAFRPRGVSRA